MAIKLMMGGISIKLKDEFDYGIDSESFLLESFVELWRGG